MGTLLELVILLICIAFWCRPVLKQRKILGGFVDRSAGAKAFFFGLIPATVVLLLCQIALGWGFRLLGLKEESVLKAFLKAFVMYGLIEEATKYGFARLALRKFHRLKKIDIMIIFGLVGAGYEITESLFSGNPLVGLMRGVFIAHIMYQFIMGHFFYESLHSKNAGNAAKSKKYALFSLLIPMLIHGFNDLFCELVELIPGTSDKESVSNMPNGQAVLTLSFFAIIIAINIFCLVWGLKLAKKDSVIEVEL